MIPFYLKPGISLSDLSPQMVLGAMIVWSIYALCGASRCTATSGNDGKHGGGAKPSKHFDGNALDFRTKDFSGDKHRLRDLIKEALGDDFDVVFEDEGGDNEHIHVEYDPK